MAETLQIRSTASEAVAALRTAAAPPASRPAASRKAVVVQSGARDAYQLALALSEAGMLEMLVTDLFWPADRTWARLLAARLPARLGALLKQRSEPGIPFKQLRLCAVTGLATLLLEKFPGASKALRRSMMRRADARLGRAAGQLATKTGATLVSYSYYAYDAFRSAPRPGILFQLHPHPASMRRILTEELQANPECAESLRQEWELSLPEEDFQHLVLEPAMAASIIVASSFTKETLVEHGTPASSINVVPYGVDSVRFHPADRHRSAQDPTLRLLFVGRINQRKGIKYLLEALRLLNRDDVHLTVCGRVVDGLELFHSFGSQVDVRPSVSAGDLVAAYQAADLFVFPSVAEGFGQVLLESLACGLPILSTTRTAARDLIEEGVQGFVIAPARADLIAERIEWALTHRQELVEMGHAARRRAQEFTWARFRAGIVASVGSFIDRQQDPMCQRYDSTPEGSAHV